jgi:hypothetical protein
MTYSRGLDIEEGRDVGLYHPAKFIRILDTMVPP